MGRVRTASLAISVVIVAGALGLYVVVARDGLAADRRPGAIETAVARRLVVLSIPSAARTQTNPHGADVDAWRDGADHFEDHCAVCHGADGRGRTPFASTMFPPVPDLASDAVQQLSDGALFAIIQHGVRWTGMPAFASSHTADETWRLVSFVRHVPHLTAAELQRATGGHAEAADHSAHERDEHAAPARTVTMDGTAFDPPSITVRVGDRVTWINKDPFPHDVSSRAGRFRSGEIDPDRRWAFRATKPGTFAYVCTRHPGMAGTLVVNP